jgi:hypothetical protein
MKITTSQLRQIVREEIQTEYAISQNTIDKGILNNVADLVKTLTDKLKTITDPKEKKVVKANLDANIEYLKFLKNNKPK